MTTSSDSMDPSEVEPAVPNDSGSGSRKFSAVLVVMAIFPFTLAIGFATRTAVPPPAKLEASEQPPPPLPNRIEHNAADRQMTDRDRTKGDDLFREGRYEAALHFYRSLGNGDSLRLPPDLAVRIAMCQEGLGLWDEALAGYRSISSILDSPVAAAAVLGQGRVWLRLGDFAKAEPLLRCLLFESGNRDLMPADVAPEVTALFALAFSEQMLPPVNLRPGDNFPPVGNLIDCSFEHAIVWTDLKGCRPAADTPDSAQLSRESATLAPSEAAGAEIAQPDHVIRQNLPVHISARKLSKAVLLEHIAGDCGLKLDWPETTRQRAMDRTRDICIEDLPPHLVLTLVCRQMDATWTLDAGANAILIRDNPADSPDLNRSRAMAEATLVSVLDTFPSDRLSDSVKFALAQLAEMRGHISDAARVYSSLVGRSSSPLAVRAAYNAGLAYHSLGDLAQAGKMLEGVIHGAPGHELHTRSIILFGRLLIDQGAFREAAFQLKRAAESRNPPEDQARAAVFCAMALLLEDRPNDAAQVLFAHRLQFQDRTVRNAAALLTSLARCRTVTGPERDRETPFLYRSIAAVEPESEWLGPSGQLLLGKAMLEAGLDDQLVEIYSRALQQGVPERVADEMSFQLADYWHAHNRADEAKSTWTRLYATNGPHHVKSGLRLAELALEEKNAKACLRICHDLMHSEGIPRFDLLKLAGRAYELCGDQILAARCYAGQWPLP